MINFFGKNPPTVNEDVAKIVEWETKIGEITEHEYSSRDRYEYKSLYAKKQTIVAECLLKIGHFSPNAHAPYQSWEMVTVKKLYDLDPYVEWMPFLNEVFNPAIRIHRHTQVGFGENIDISLTSEQEYG